MVAASSGFASVRGVEFAHELCEIAKENCDIYKRRTGLHTEFQIVESDAVEYPIRSDENVFFLFHPFDDVILKEILGNIVTSLESQQRRVLIIYNNPKHGHVIEQQEGFAKLGEYVLCGSRFTLYSNSDQAGVAGLDW